MSPVPEKTRLKVAYPGIVVARKRARLDIPGDGERLAVDWESIGVLLVWLEGHGHCGGWDFIPVTQRITCACGSDLFEVTDPVCGVSAA